MPLFPNIVYSQAPYYQGKTITILRGGEPGGSGDMQARALIPFPKKIYSGKPDDYRRKRTRRRGHEGR
jgi:hypothetical protein